MQLSSLPPRETLTVARTLLGAAERFGDDHSFGETEAEPAIGFRDRSPDHSQRGELFDRAWSVGQQPVQHVAELKLLFGEPGRPHSSGPWREKAILPTMLRWISFDPP